MDRAAAAAPEQPDAWFEVGDLAFHSPWLGAATGDGRARAFFQRALMSARLAPALQHFVQASAADGDRQVAVRSIAALALTRPAAADGRATS